MGSGDGLPAGRYGDRFGKRGFYLQGSGRRVAAHARDVGWVDDGDCLGVLVLSMVRLGVNLFVFLQVLRALEALVADLAGVGFEGNMDAHVASYMIAFGAGGLAVLPATGQ